MSTSWIELLAHDWRLSQIRPYKLKVSPRSVTTPLMANYLNVLESVI